MHLPLLPFRRAGLRLALTAAAMAALVGCASGGAGSGRDTGAGRESGITVFGTVDAAVSHTRNR